MKNRRFSELSESEVSDESPQASQTKSVRQNSHPEPSSDSSDSSDSEERQAPPTPPVPQEKSPKRKKIFSSPLERFTSQHPGLNKIEINDVVQKHDDVCILEVPKTIDCNDFLGKLVNFDRRTKLKLNGIKYVIEPSLEDIKPINLISEGLKVIHPVANLKLRKYIKHKQESEAVTVGKFIPTVPEIKVRHPLFGVEYKNKIVLDENIQRKLDNKIEEALKKIKKKKKHNKQKIDKHSKEEEVQETNNDESIFALLESHISDELKRKQSLEDFSENKNCIKEEQKEFTDFDDKHNKKNKRKNSVKEDILSIINQSLLNDYVNCKNENHCDTSTQSEDSVSTKGSKKKKHKNHVKEERIKLPINSEGVEESKDDSRGKKKSKRKTSVNEDMLSIINQSILNNGDDKTAKSDDSETEEKSSKGSKKKNRKHSVREEEVPEGIQSLTNSIDFEEHKDDSVREKKKKRIHSIKEEPQEDKTGMANSTLISGLKLPLFDFDMSGIMCKDETEKFGIEKTPKKNKNKSLNYSDFDESFKEKSDDKDYSENDDNSRKKKKRKLPVENELTEESEFPVKKKKKSHNFDSEGEASSHKKSKMIKEESYNSEAETSSRKKHKKIKQEEIDETTNSLILDILSKVKSELDTSIKNIKREKLEG